MNGSPPTNLLGAFRAQALVASVLAETRRLDESVVALLDGIGATLGFELATLWSVGDDDEHLTCSAHRGDGKALRFSGATQELALRRGDCSAGMAWAQGQQVWTDDLRHLVLAPRRALAAVEGLRTNCATPIHAGGSVRAVLELVTYEERPFEETTSIALTAIAAQIGLFYERQLVEERYSELASLLDQHVYDSATPLSAA